MVLQLFSSAWMPILPKSLLKQYYYNVSKISLVQRLWFSRAKVMVQELPIEEQPWYFGNTPLDDCVALLKRNGDFLVRFSTTTNGYVVTFWWKGKALHSHIEQIKSKVHTYVCDRACKNRECGYTVT